MNRIIVESHTGRRSIPHLSAARGAGRLLLGCFAVIVTAVAVSTVVAGDGPDPGPTWCGTIAACNIQVNCNGNYQPCCCRLNGVQTCVCAYPHECGGSASRCPDDHEVPGAPG